MSVNVRDNIYSEIASQFPDVYKENSDFLIGFVESYYQHLDTKMDRDIPKLRDIDTTLSTFLVYYKKKFLADLPLDASIDIRFIVKHILDVYKRKGTEDSLRLLFKLFFDEEIEVYYPSTAILRPSDSIWGGDTYLEMNPVFNVDDYIITRGDRIVGDLSLASAFVDDIIFVNFSGALTPIVYLSNLAGEFKSDDSISISSTSNTGGNTSINIGKIISGSISDVTLRTGSRTPGQKVGDKISLVSSSSGVDAEGVVTKTSNTETGQIVFNIEDGGYGYVVPGSQSVSNDVGVSNHVLIVDSLNEYQFKPGDVITAGGSTIRHDNFGAAGTQLYGVTGSAQVISYRHPLLFIKTNKNTPEEMFSFLTTSYESPINDGYFRNALYDTYFNAISGTFVNEPPAVYKEPYYAKFTSDVAGFPAADFDAKGTITNGANADFFLKYLFASNTVTEQPIAANNFVPIFDTVVGSATKEGDVYTVTSGGSYSARFENTNTSSYPLWLSTSDASKANITIVASFTGTQRIKVIAAQTSSGGGATIDTGAGTLCTGDGTSQTYVINMPASTDRVWNYLALEFETEDVAVTVTSFAVNLAEDTENWNYYGANVQTSERWPAISPLPPTNNTCATLVDIYSSTVVDGDYLTIQALGNMTASEWQAAGATYGAVGEDFVLKNKASIPEGRTDTKVYGNEYKLSASRMLNLFALFNTHQRFVISDITTASTTTNASTIMGPGVFIDTLASPYFIPTELRNPNFDVIVNGDKTKIVKISGIGEKNDSADFKISNIDNIERVTIIQDQVGEFVRIFLNSEDYGMSGEGAESIGSTIEEAFDPLTLTIGSISETLSDSPGSNYTSDVGVRVLNDIVAKFDKKDIILNFDDINFFLREGDVLSQQIILPGIALDQVNGLSQALIEAMPATSETSATTFTLNPTQIYTAKIVFLKREGNDFYFRPRSFYSIDDTLPIMIKGSSKNITSLSRDETSAPMGANANIVGEARYLSGQIEEVALTKSGYKFSDGEKVSVVNLEELSESYNNTVALANVRTLGQGKTEGRWRSKTSFISEESKRLHDNDYYQEYSYDVSSLVDPTLYNDLLDQTVSVAGTKRFSTPLINSSSEISSELDVAFTFFDIVSQQLFFTTDGEDKQAITEAGDFIHASVSRLKTLGE